MALVFNPIAEGADPSIYSSLDLAITTVDLAKLIGVQHGT